VAAHDLVQRIRHLPVVTVLAGTTWDGAPNLEAVSRADT
jgi:hypothetical protein